MTNLNDRYYQAIELDNEVRVVLRRAIGDARIFSGAGSRGVAPLALQILSTSLVTNLTTLRDLLDIRYGPLEFMGKAAPIEVGDFVTPESADRFRRVMTNIEQRARRVVDGEQPPV